MFAKLARVAGFVFLAVPALAQQAVQQSGSVTPGHATSWTTAGVVQDAGASSAGNLNTLGITSSNLGSFCINSGPISAPYQALCMGLSPTNGQGAISLNSYDSATPLSFNFNVNGINALNISPNGTVLVNGVTTTFVANNTQLKAVTTQTTVYRAGFSTPGDGGGAFYNFSTSPCSISGGDNGSQVQPNSGTGCWLVAIPPPGISVKVWGAVGNGTTDDTSALNTAFASGFPVIVPAANFYTASGVTIPGNGNVTGASFLAGSPPYQGSTITCALLVAVCVTAGSNNNTPVTIKKLVIARAAGTLPASGAECLKINGVDGATVEDVACYRHAEGFHLYSDGAYGTIFHGLRLYTCAISDSHFVIDAWPVARVEQSYFGCNGAFDVNGNSFIKVTNGDGTGGPNTVNFTNNQFNLGAASTTVTDWLSFQSLGTGQGTAIQDFEFYGNHVETAQNLVATDSTATLLTDLVIQGGWMVGGWGGGNHIMALNAATIPDEWKISNVEFDNWGDFTLAPSSSGNPMQFVDVSHNIFQSNTVSITGNSTAAKVNFADNVYLGNVTATGDFQYARFTGIPAGGTYTNTANGLIASNLPNMQQTWTPAIIGATTTGTTTYTTQAGQFDTDFSRATVNFNVATSAALSGFVGNIGIGNLPKPAINAGINGASCGIGSWAGITLDSGYTQLTLQIGAGSSIANIAEVGSALGSKFLQQSNFTGTSVAISGTCSYRFQ